MIKRILAPLLLVLIAMPGFADTKILELPVLYIHDYLYDGPTQTYNSGKVVFESCGKYSQTLKTYFVSPEWQGGKDYVSFSLIDLDKPGLTRYYDPKISPYANMMHAGRMYQIRTVEPQVPQNVQIFQAGYLSNGNFTPVYICISLLKYGKVEAIAFINYSESRWNQLVSKIYNATVPIR